MVTNKQKLLIELGIIALISYWFFFISTNVNPTLGNIYTNITIGAGIFFLADYFFGKKEIKLVNEKHSWGKMLIVGVVGYVLLLVSSNLASSLSQIIPLSESLKLLGATAPAFSDSPLINFITFGDVIAYIETYALFIVGLDLLASVFNISINKENLSNPKLWGIIFGIAILFLFLHITAKGIESEAILLLVFFMAVISMVLTVIYQDGRPAIILHVLANSIAATALFVTVPATNLIVSVISFIPIT